jgi:FlaA1/EpsC-like NDP-sugar epimerase
LPHNSSEPAKAAAFFNEKHFDIAQHLAVRPQTPYVPAANGAVTGHLKEVARVEIHAPNRALLTQWLRRIALAGLTAVVLLGCRWLAYQLRFDFAVLEQYQLQLEGHWRWVIPLQLGCLFIFRQFSGIYRYFSLPDLQHLAMAMGLSGALLYGVHYFNVGYAPPRGVILLQVLLGFLAIGGMRAGWRMAYERWYSGQNHTSFSDRKVGIIGAGDVGASLVRDLHAHPHLGLVPVVFFDDNPQKRGSCVHGIRVAGTIDSIPRQQRRFEFEQVIIAMPSAPPKRLAEVVALLQEAKIKYVTVPGIDQLTSGEVSVSQLRPVRIEDLLGREPIDLRVEQISGVLAGRTVMVTGAGGSIGSELCRQVAAFHPRELLLVEQSEVQMFQIEQELIRLGYGAMIKPLIGDILDKPRMSAILSQHRPSVIFHAAAHKHVTMMEIQPSEAIKNNALGTAQLAELALEWDVERFVMISTDKAVNPTSVMGASKRLAEVFLQAFAERHPNRTRFVAVRFGNVLGSSGSVVPIFERQIAQGGPVTVTDPEVVRFFMTIPEAVGLVLQSCAQGQGGEIFVLDMGKAIKIADLARQMVRLSGLEPDRDIEIKYIGLRPGEKLYEELHHLQANCTDTAHPRIKRLTSEPPTLEKARENLGRFNGELHAASADELKATLRLCLPEYTPCYSHSLPAEGSARPATVATPSPAPNKPSEMWPQPWPTAVAQTNHTPAMAAVQQVAEGGQLFPI